MAVIAAAERTFREVFTEEGFARQRHLHGEAAALRQVAERVRGLHASLAVMDDPSILRAVVDAAPPEVRGAVSLIGEIARIQRDTVARRGKIEARELQESDEALQRIMRQLGATPTTSRYRSVVSFDETSKNARWTSYDEILRRERLRNPQAESSGNLSFLPDSLGAIGQGMADELFGLGGADSAFQMYGAWLRGDTDSALQIFRDAAIEAVPSWGSAYSVAKSLREARDAGDVWPIVQFAANIGAGAAVGPLYGAVMAVLRIRQHGLRDRLALLRPAERRKTPSPGFSWAICPRPAALPIPASRRLRTGATSRKRRSCRSTSPCRSSRPSSGKTSCGRISSPRPIERPGRRVGRPARRRG